MTITRSLRTRAAHAFCLGAMIAGILLKPLADLGLMAYALSALCITVGTVPALLIVSAALTYAFFGMLLIVRILLTLGAGIVDMLGFKH